MDLLNILSSLRPADVTEILASALAVFGLTVGLGKIALEGYRTGKPALTAVSMQWLHAPMAGAMLLRIATFRIDNLYPFFVAVDLIGLALLAMIALQFAGLFLKKQ